MQLLRNEFHVGDHLFVLLHVIELHIHMEHVVPRFAGDRGRLQLGHVDRAVFNGTQHLDQRAVFVIGLEAERGLVRPLGNRLARRTQQQEAGLIGFDRMDIRRNNF